MLFPCYVEAASVSKISLSDDSELQFNGSTNFTVAARHQSNSYDRKQLDNATNNRQNSSSDAENNAQLFIKLTNKKTFESDQQFGALLKLESEVSSAQEKGVINADQGYIFNDSKEYGKVEIGDNIAVNQKMKVGPSSFLRGSGGINGNYLKYINIPNANQFILIPQSPIGHGGQAISGSQTNQNSITILRNGSFNGAEDASKINYYSPRIEGVQVGASYTPNTANSLISSTVFNGQQNAILDVFSAAVNYTNNYENFDYAFSATTEVGKAKSSNQNNLSAYDLAATAAYFGFTFGASYGSWNKSLQSHQNQNSTYKSAAIAYQIGPISISLSSFRSSYQKNDYRAHSLGLDYKLSRVFIPYVEFTNFSFKPNQANSSAKNTGFVALTGFILTF